MDYTMWCGWIFPGKKKNVTKEKRIVKRITEYLKYIQFSKYSKKLKIGNLYEIDIDDLGKLRRLTITLHITLPDDISDEIAENIYKTIFDEITYITPEFEPHAENDNYTEINTASKQQQIEDHYRRMSHIDCFNAAIQSYKPSIDAHYKYDINDGIHKSTFYLKKLSIIQELIREHSKSASELLTKYNDMKSNNDDKLQEIEIILRDKQIITEALENYFKVIEITDAKTILIDYINNLKITNEDERLKDHIKTSLECFKVHEYLNKRHEMQKGK